MGYFDSGDNVKEYLKIAEGYDGRELIEILKNYLPVSSGVLELGMGPGKDLDILSYTFEVTGSDNSKVFLDLYRKKNRATDLVLLDAVEMDIDRKFDCIYSNKVLHHLKKKELKVSFKKQYDVLNDGVFCFTHSGMVIEKKISMA